MRKLIILGFIAFVSFQNVKAQLLSGELLESNRYLLQKSDFTIESSTEGVVLLDLAVNEKGLVTSYRIITERSTIKSTPLKMQAINYVKKFEFLAGSLFPEFQHVIVQINFVKKED
jgi:hypothetical protein